MGLITSYQTAEYGKFIQLNGSTSYPPVSVVRWSYSDDSSAFPSNSALPPVSSVDIYPKYAVLTQMANYQDLSNQLSTITRVLCAILNK